MTTTTRPWRRATMPDPDRMTDIDLSDELCRLAAIAAAVSVAIEGSSNFPDDRKKDGAIWLSDQLAAELGALADAFWEERKLRKMAEEDAADRRVEKQ